MKLKYIIASILIIACIFAVPAQQRGTIKTYTEKGVRKISDGYDRVPCTETYSYYEDATGNYVRHGSYSISGSKTLNSSNYIASLNVVTSYSAKATFKDGWLNGTLTINTTKHETGSNRGQKFSYKYVHTYVGNFVDGIPHGSWKFTTVTNGKTVRDIRLNFNHGVLSGNLYTLFDGETHKGAFDSNGSPVGEWSSNYLSNKTTTVKYNKGVLVSFISRDNGAATHNSVTDTEHANMISKYINGQITEEELMQQSYAVIDRKEDFREAYAQFFEEYILNIDAIGGIKSRVPNSEVTLDLEPKYKMVLKLEMLTEELIQVIKMTYELIPWSNELKTKYSEYGSYFVVSQDNDTGHDCVIYSKQRKEHQLFGTEEQINRIKEIHKILDLKRDKMRYTNYLIATKQANEPLANVFILVYNNLFVNDVEKLELFAEIYKSFSELYRRIEKNKNTKEAFLSYYKDINNYEDAISFITNTELHNKIEDDILAVAAQLQEAKDLLEEEDGKFRTSCAIMESELIKQIEGTNKAASRTRTIQTIRDTIKKNNVNLCYVTLNAFVRKKHPGVITNYDDVMILLKAAKIRTRIFEGKYALSYYHSLAETCVDVESCLKFLNLDFDLYDKYFDVNRLYSKRKISYNMLFKNVLKQYNKKYIVNAFTIVWDNTTDEDLELRHKVLDIVIEMHSKNTKKAEKVAKKIATYEQAIYFFENQAISLCE